ncbi:hypothetical protein [Burkholderia sp. JKS000303]|nr:hypothetical protein [Burkholderia sp. JKS000303]
MNAIASYQRGWNDRMLGRPFAPCSVFDTAYRAGYADARGA